MRILKTSMLLWILNILILNLLLVTRGASAETTVQIPEDKFMVLAFHDIRDDVVTGTDRDPYAISTARLAHFFDWMKLHNWNPVSFQQVIDAQQGKIKLPKNPVLLTFDDGLASHYKNLFALLQVYHYPAVLALQTGWVSGDVKETTTYKGESMHFINWDQLREMRDSGLVEFATHSHNLHKGILANPQGNLEPAAISHLYDATTHSYESDATYAARVQLDLKTSADVIQRELGVKPRVVVWPYGAMTMQTSELARAVGLPFSFGLGRNELNDIYFNHFKKSISRVLISGNPTAIQIEQIVGDVLKDRKQTQRAVQIDLDDVYDPNPTQMEKNLGDLLDRIKALRIHTVYLQAFADPDGDGTASELYFPNRHLPMKADLFNRVTWQLQTRAGVDVYAWLPLLAFDLVDKTNQERLAVKVNQDGKLVPAKADYRRLSPFLPESGTIIGDIYADLAKSTPSVNGVLIHDDAYLSADEDASSCQPEARWPKTNQPISDCQKITPREKTNALIDFGDVVIDRLNYFHNTSDNLSVARNLYARVVMDPEAEARFAQALEPFVQHYDDVALMAMPYLDGTTMPAQSWLMALADRVARVPNGLNKVTFELQAKDWRENKWIKGSILRDWMLMLTRRGAKNLAYYPDDFLNNTPKFEYVFAGSSLNEVPATYTSPYAKTAKDKPLPEKTTGTKKPFSLRNLLGLGTPPD